MKQLTELHGGRVAVASAGPNHGACFTVTLPAMAAPATAAAVPAPPARQPASCRVLLVEDNDDLREMMRISLELSGHTVLAAGDACPASVRPSSTLPMWSSSIWACRNWTDTLWRARLARIRRSATC